MPLGPASRALIGCVRAASSSQLIPTSLDLGQPLKLAHHICLPPPPAPGPQLLPQRLEWKGRRAGQ